MLILNKIPVNVTIFPDKTSQCWKISNINPDINQITWVWENNEAELFHLVQLVHLINSEFPDPYIKLHLPYTPYARQDKSIGINTTFALHTFAKIINSLKLNLITTFDVHSNESTKLIKNLVNIDPMEFHDWVIRKFQADIIFYPDKGAATRYRTYPNKTVYGEKVRNQLTGFIEGYKVVNQDNVDLFGKRVIIIDDICDGGATFIACAKALKDLGAGELGLCVSHGIFSKGKEALENAGITCFYTTNSLVCNKEGYVVYE